MTPSAPALGGAAHAGRSTRHRGYWRDSLERILDDRVGLFFAALIGVMALLAIAAPLLAANVTRFGPDDQDLTQIFAAPSPAHWLGTDELGRDTLTRLLYGARVSLGVAGLSVALTLLLGTTVGLVAGFYGAYVDQILMRFVDTLLAIPQIYLLIMMSILLRPGLVTLAILLAVISWIPVARVVRAEVLATKALDFVLAARAVGCTDSRLMIRHLLPAAIPVMIVAASLQVGAIILIQASLDFLGLGIAPPTPSWGNMITTARQYFSQAVYVSFFAGLAIFLTVLALNVAGNAIRDAFDPRLRR